MGSKSLNRRRLPVLYLYVEGDDVLRKSMQEGIFRGFRQRLMNRYEFRIIAGEGNSETVTDWIGRREQASPGDIVLLLIDSEGPISANPNQPPQGCTSFLTSADLATGDVYFMVQLMESWFLVEPEHLATLYRKEFNASRLPAVPSGPSPARPGDRLEAVPKSLVEAGLKAATMGAYSRASGKTRVAPEMLQRLSLEKIARESFHANSLLERLQSL